MTGGRNLELINLIKTTFLDRTCSHRVLAGLAESRLYLYKQFFFFWWSRKFPTRREPRTPTPIPTTAPSTRVLPVLSTFV